MIKERFDQAIQERDYVDFKNMILRGKVSHRTLASIIGEEALLHKTRGWNPHEWNWHNMQKFTDKKRGQRAHPYQRASHHPQQRQQQSHQHHQQQHQSHPDHQPYQRVEHHPQAQEQVVEGSGTIGQRVDRLNGLLSAIAVS